MASRASRLGFLIVFLALIVIASGERSKSEEAYVTLLYGDEFLLGVRVLGKSIRDTKTTRDLVALVSDGVSDYAKKLLQADGWKVELISLLANPNQVRPTRFWGVYTKLKIFNMTRYKKVVYLDADTVVVKSVDDLFQCGRFCANLKHSERLNSGVMVVEPSAKLFEDMMRQVTSLPSYTGGDQGFLNSYYADFPNARVFVPNLSAEIRNTRPQPEMERLSTLYNADVGLYMLANKWMVDEKELRVIHYTLGPLKPWDWWTAWLVKPVDFWQEAREKLEESLPGTGGGRNPNDQLFVNILFALPLCALLYCFYRYLQINNDSCSTLSRSSLCDYSRRIYYKYKSSSVMPSYSGIGVASSSIGSSNQRFVTGTNSRLSAYLGAISVFFCFMAAILSLTLAFIVVPRQVMPWTGLLLMYEWTCTTFFVVFACYLQLVYQWGKASASQTSALSTRDDSSDYDSGKGHQRSSSSCDIVTWSYGTGMILLAVIAPSLPCILGITALFARLGLMVAGGMVLACFMTYAAEHLAIRSFARGVEDRDLPRTRSICLMC